jgi:molybdopterin/thiamine biosynthesis adenylyltransferase
VRTELRLIERHWAKLTAHLLAADGDEHAAVLLCGTVSTEEATLLLVQDVVTLDGADLLSSGALHLSVSPVALARITKRARVGGGTIVLCHSHPFPGCVQPSALDLDTERELCGRALAGRLAPHDVGALILGPDGFDGRLWRAGASVPLERVRILGDTLRALPSQPIEVAVEEPAAMVTDRQVRAWGAAGQRALGSARIGVIGCGGTGSHVVQQLAHLGLGRMLLIDDDHVETTNLSRIVGSRASDVGRSKVQVLADAARRINEDVDIRVAIASVLDTDPGALATLDLLFCCTDGHGSRSLLSELCQQYLLPVIDLGVEIVPGPNRLQAGGGVRVLRPGEGCLLCAGTLDPVLVREEYLNTQDRSFEAQHGYLRGAGEPAPSVIALNGVVASLAVLEACHLLARMYTTGRQRLLLRADERRLTTVTMPQDPTCHVCGEQGLLGRGNSQPTSSRWTARRDYVGKVDR